MLVELAVTEQRYRAVLEVLEGASVVEVARRFGVARQTVHTCLRRYAAAGGLANLADRSSRPGSLAPTRCHRRWNRACWRCGWRTRDGGRTGWSSSWPGSATAASCPAGCRPGRRCIGRWRDTGCSTRPDAAVGGPTTGAGNGAGHATC
jgi:hypothetical protein